MRWPNWTGGISEETEEVYGDENLRFGAEHLIPKPFDPRLIRRIAPAVAQAAMDSGVAERPIADMKAYRERLEGFVYHSKMLMKPVFEAAKRAPQRLVYAEGEESGCCTRCRQSLTKALPIRSWSVGRRSSSNASPSSVCASVRGAFRTGQSRKRYALPRILERVSPPDAAQRRDARHGQARDAPQQYPDRCDARAAGPDAMLCGTI